MNKDKFELNYMYDFSLLIKTKIDQGDFDECINLISDKMSEYPHSPVPHNLLGIMMEIRGNHVLAMKHFRAARALDPCYIPATENLENFGIYSAKREYVF